MRIEKAVFPVAGIGSRFLPVTKANPKEMLPIVDKPLIQYAVEEAVRAGITHMIFITSSSKRAIEDHFDTHFELEMRLAQRENEQLLQLVQNISPPGIQFTYVRQHQPLGLGHAVLCAEHVIGHSPFAVLLADDLIDESTAPCLSAMAEEFQSHGQSVIAVQHVDWQEVHHYGIVALQERAGDNAGIKCIIEKPSPATAPSNLAAVGRYIFTPTIFSCLRQTSIDQRGEVQLTDAIKQLLDSEVVYPFQFKGIRYDCGSKLGYLKAVVEFGMKHEEVGKAFQEYLLAAKSQ